MKTGLSLENLTNVPDDNVWVECMHFWLLLGCCFLLLLEISQRFNILDKVLQLVELVENHLKLRQGRFLQLARQISHSDD